jgi:D-3-phosphoglycerate dehydrogenase
MSWRVLVTAPYLQRFLKDYSEELSAAGIEVLAPPVTQSFSETELMPLLKGVDGVICGDDAFTRTVLENADRLRVISKWGIGIDAIDLDAARDVGVQVFNTPGTLARPVADSVMGWVLCFARRLPWMDREMKLGRWTKLPSLSLAECTIGIVGVGSIGSAVARRAAAFEMRIVGSDVQGVPQELVDGTGIEEVTFEALLEVSDFVTLHASLDSSTKGLMGPQEFGRMKPTSCLINTSRGGLVDEQALIKALEEGAIAGAALDVFEVEPLPLHSPLLRMDNVLLSPHNANSSPAAARSINRAAIDNLIRGLSA